MSAFFTIELKNLRFFADHGLYEQELRTGNEFEVEVSIDCAAPEEVVRSIDQTINYVDAYNIVKNVFGKRTDLLETAAMEMANQLKERFQEADKIVIRITKMHPPITGFPGAVSVVYSKSFR
ncbi:MAG TPA: dihydroneopterin aldolase [Flavisolibacter sp.]|nr:dihydroneopterin aldolase [Flavisolibacter sp.]